ERKYSVSDKELLTFCNLTNLKMEYANLKKVEEKTDENGELLVGTKKEVNHTIYSLLEEEYEGIQNKESLKKKLDIAISDEVNYKYNDEWDTEEKENYLNKIEKYQEILRKEKEQKFGNFYKINKDNIKVYFYNDKKELRESASIVMEYFDRYNVSNDKENHEGAFLKEWEILQAFDSYNLGKYLYNNVPKTSEIEKIFTLKDFPSRVDVENEKYKQMFFACVEYAYIGIANLQLGATPIPQLNKMSVSTIVSTSVKKYGRTAINNFENISKVTKKTLGTENIGNALAYIIGFSSTEAAPLKTEMEGYIAGELEDNYSIEVKSSKFTNVNFSLTDDILKFIILRKKNTNTYVVSIYNHKKLSSIQEIREEILPKYMFPIVIGIQNILSDEKNEIIFTGAGNAGALANVLNLWLANYDSKGFYIKDPSLVSTVANFTPKDFGYLSTFEILKSIFTFKELYKSGTMLLGIKLGKAGPVGLAVWTLYALYNIREEVLTIENKNKEVEEVYKKLIELRVLKTSPKKIITINTPEPKRMEYKLEEYDENSSLSFVVTDESFENGLEAHNKDIILGEIDSDQLKTAHPLNIILKNKLKAGSTILNLKAKPREHIIFKLLEKRGYDIVDFNEKIVIFNKEFNFIIFYFKEEKYKTLRLKRYYAVEEEIFFDGEHVRTYLWKEINYSSDIKGYPEDKIDTYKEVRVDSINSIPIEKAREELINGISMENLPPKAFLIEELLHGREDGFFIFDHSSLEIIDVGMMMSAQLEQLSNIQTYLKNNKNNKSYGAYLEKIGNNHNIKLESKYLSPKENKLSRNENSSSQIEYLFFPFLSKEGVLTPNLREEYISNCIKSVVVKRFLVSDKYLDWNFDSEVGFKRSNYSLPETEARKWIMNLLKNVKDKTKSYPYINLVVKILDENKLKKYSKLQEDANGNPEIILGIVDENNKYLKDELGFIYNPDDKIIGKELTLYIKKMSKEEKNGALNPTASPIVDGIILKCSYGSKVTELKVTSQKHLTMRGRLAAVVKDNIPNINILPFGTCKKLPSSVPCPLAITGEWLNNSKIFTILGSKVLLDCSTMKCALGGEIKAQKGVVYWKSR
ncbi:MAG: DUF4280 domain-containing protein, partial [Clostridium sp.]